MFNLNDLNVTGGAVLTGKRNSNNDPNREIRSTPTAGKLSLSDGFIRKSGFASEDVIMFLVPATEIGGVAVQYPFPSTFTSNDPTLYALIKSGSGEEAYGNKINGGPGAPSFSSASAWNTLRGKSEGSNFFGTTKVYGFAIYANDAKDRVEQVVAVTDENAKTLTGFVGILVPQIEDRGISYSPVDSMDKALQVNPLYIIQFTSYEAKGSGPDEEEAVNTASNEEVFEQAEELVFED